MPEGKEKIVHLFFDLGVKGETRPSLMLPRGALSPLWVNCSGIWSKNPFSLYKKSSVLPDLGKVLSGSD